MTPSPSVLAAGTDDGHHEPDAPTKRRKLVGGLRPVASSKLNVERESGSIASTPGSPRSQDEFSRQLQSDGKKLPQRKKPHKGGISREPCSADKLIAGIWKTIYGSIKTSPPSWLESSEDVGAITPLGPLKCYQRSMLESDLLLQAEGMTTTALDGRLGQEVGTPHAFPATTSTHSYL